MQLNASPLPGIYLHIPFCQHKCGYCDFYSVTQLQQRSAFVEALQKEIHAQARMLPHHEPFDTIYFGGGTPSLLPITDVQSILNTLHEMFSIAPDAEITFEVNPGTIDAKGLVALRKTGVNRLSVGVQSFNDDELRFLDRIHDAGQAGQVVRKAHKAGFEHLSLDLIFAQPGQTIQSWAASMDKAIELPVDHISAYNLIYEEGTPFYRAREKGQIVPHPENQEIDFWYFTLEHMQRNGFSPYEVSNFSRSVQAQSRHNVKYWTHTPYLGFGPSAHSFWEGRRWSNRRDVRYYQQALKQNISPLASEEFLDPATLEFEHIFLRLRTYSGLDLTEFEHTFKTSFTEKYEADCQDLVNQELAILDAQTFKLTPKGMLICDALLPEFYRP